MSVTVEIFFKGTDEIMQVKEFDNEALASEFCEVFNAGHKGTVAKVRKEVQEVEVFKIEFTTLDGVRAEMTTSCSNEAAAQEYADTMAAWQAPKVVKVYDYR
jgi:hypothetical protein